MTQKLRALFGLKWNPFSPNVPAEALWRSPQIEHFCWRIEELVRDGGFALITGDPGTGKSVALRILAHHLEPQPDVLAAVLTRPQSSLGDFYRELGDLFGVTLAPHNRWTGFKTLRQTWLTHVEAT
ncbi:MAG: AAA family ATPase, partial [bacterium]|nr:AAA family ATPase [bacterium]